METPSRRVTRSQTLSAIKSSASIIPSSSKKTEEETNKCQSKSRQRNSDRSVLFDITNDSPIVGVAMSNNTPSSGLVSKRSCRINTKKSTPGSGEALLRGQVKTLLQNIKEEQGGEDSFVKILKESRRWSHLITSPMGLLAPTPANTPQVLDSSCDKDQVKITIASPIAPSQVEKEESLMSPRITRSLLLDFISDKSEISSYDNSSLWSMQVNESTKDNNEEEEEEVYASYTEEGEEEEEEIVEKLLCERMRKMRVESGREYEGKHTRFVYDSEGGEIVDAKVESPTQVKGFVTPTHVRFDS
ncbi:unnamed protein product [Cochlearia groenlandica]